MTKIDEISAMKDESEGIDNRHIIGKMAREILNDYAPDWKFEFGVETECIGNDIKKIHLKDENKTNLIYYAFELIIHEVAHIGEKSKSSKEAHSSKFYQRMGDLLKKYAYIVDKYAEKYGKNKEV